MEPGLLLFALFFLLLFLGVPILTSLGVSALLFLWQYGRGVQVAASNFYANVARFPLLAIPFFILAGYVMNHPHGGGGGGGRIRPLRGSRDLPGISAGATSTRCSATQRSPPR